MCYAVFSAGPDTRQLIGNKQQSTWDLSCSKANCLLRNSELC